MTDPIWWVYLFWLPKFLNAKFGLNILQLGLPLIVIYVVADVGSIGGGWLSSKLIKKGWSVNAGRKTAMLICALCVVPIVFASIGGMLIASTVGLILEYTKSAAFPNGNYFSIFVIAGSAYLTALLIMHLLAPKLEPVELGEY